MPYQQQFVRTQTLLQRPHSQKPPRDLSFALRKNVIYARAVVLGVTVGHSRAMAVVEAAGMQRAEEEHQRQGM